MEDFKERLVNEQTEVESKLNKLNDFNQGMVFATLEDTQKQLLVIQAGAMYTYNECLKARILSL